MGGLLGPCPTALTPSSSLILQKIYIKNQGDGVNLVTSEDSAGHHRNRYLNRGNFLGDNEQCSEVRVRKQRKGEGGKEAT